MPHGHAKTNIAGIILAAGASTRMGSPKALLKVGRRTLLEDQISRLRRAGCGPIIVVVGGDAERIIEALGHKDIRFVVNKEWRFGQFSSTKAGFKALKDISRGCLLLPVDIPFVPVAIMKRIIKFAADTKPAAVIPVFHHKGHPIWVSGRVIKIALRADTKTCRLDRMLEKIEDVRLLPMRSPAVVNNVNTRKEWKGVVRTF